MILSLAACSDEGKPRPAAGGIHAKSGDVYPKEFLTFDETDVEFDLFRYYYLNYKNMYLEEDASYFKKKED